MICEIAVSGSRIGSSQVYKLMRMQGGEKRMLWSRYARTETGKLAGRIMITHQPEIRTHMRCEVLF